jgi:hypothetical protein
MHNKNHKKWTLINEWREREFDIVHANAMGKLKIHEGGCG